MLPAFATIDDLAARLPSDIAGPDDARAQAALDDASALVRSYAGKSWVTDDVLDSDVPDIIVTVTVRCALRSFTNPSGVSQESAGPFSASYANSSSDVYLTAAEKAQVRKAAGRTGIAPLPTTRGDLETPPVLDRWPASDQLVDVEGGEPAVYNE